MQQGAVMLVQGVLADLRNGRFYITDHAYLRMMQRGVVRRDIQSVGMTCAEWKLQSNFRFKITGLDTDGDELTIICVYDEQTLIITLY